MAGKEAPEGGPRIIAVASGKGGTGKSLVAANVGIFLATLGRRVVVVDAAFGSANLHQFVGVPRPHHTLAQLLANASVPVDQVIVDTGIPSLGLLAAEGDPATAANPKSAQVNKLIARLRQIDADVVVLDLAGGTAGTTLDLFLVADAGVVVVVPEPPAVELGYRLMRAAFVRRLRKVGIGAAADFPADELRMYEGGIPSPIDIRDRARDLDEGLADRVDAEMRRFRPRLVVNMARSKADMALCGDLARAVQRRFGVPVDPLGYLEYDDAVSVSVRRRRPLLVEHPESRVARCLEKVARRLVGRDTAELPALPASPETYYDLLGVDPGATEEEIRRANRRVREVYGRDSLVVGALYNKSRLDDLHVKLDEAYETLMDPTSRKAYDQALFPGGVPQAARREDSDNALAAVDRAAPAEPAPPPRPSPPPLAPDTEFTGALLREVREAMGIDLRAIAERTKIGMAYLEAIEEENVRKLPATVYVRGFLVQIARMLQLDEERVVDTYLARFRRARAATQPG